MVSLDSTIVNLANLTTASQDHIKEALELIIENIQNDELKIKDLVVKLNPLLTAANYELRSRGVDLLSQVITRTERSQFNGKEIEVLTEYLSTRLSDHKLMQEPVLRTLLYFVSCESKPQTYNNDVLELTKSKTNVNSMNRESRLLVYRILREVIIEKRQRTANIDSDLFYSLIHLIEGESEPENLMSCFGIISYVMKNFTNLEPYVDDAFEWLSSYYPLDYTPDKNDSTSGAIISKTDLSKALYDCFFASPLNSDNLQTLMLEKIEMNQLKSTKIESLNCLIKLYELYHSINVKDYATTLWTSIRANCLMNTELVDPILLDACYRALSAMTKRLSDDNYFTFISDMYEELSIAIRKPEMDLFEPAICLITHAIQPRVVGFNLILTKILPTSIKAISASELRPARGLSYIFEQLAAHHPNAKLIPELDEPLNELTLQISVNAPTDESCMRLLNFISRCKIRLEKTILDAIINNLLVSLNRSTTDVEESLALICANYQRSDILFDEFKSDCQLDSLIKLVQFYTDSSESENKTTKSMHTKLSIYLRLLILLLDEAECSALNRLNQADVINFLQHLRSLIKQPDYSRLAEIVGLVHSIMINKLSNEFVQLVLVDVFQSDYCQNLVPKEKSGRELSCNAYLPVVGQILKSLVIRNHQLAAPMINLILNYITSDAVDQMSALRGVQIFSFILSDCSKIFNRGKHYQIFTLYKQKFYALTIKNIKDRLITHKEGCKRYLLLTSVASQIPNLPPSVFKRDLEWLMREILKILTTLKDSVKEDEESTNETLISLLYECIESLIAHSINEDMSSFLGSLIELNLFYATEARKMNIRKRGLICLSIIATTFKESDLLVSRSSVLQRLKPCLADKKRIVRQAASEARLRWVLVGQPIGSL